MRNIRQYTTCAQLYDTCQQFYIERFLVWHRSIKVCLSDNQNEKKMLYVNNLTLVAKNLLEIVMRVAFQTCKV